MKLSDKIKLIEIWRANNHLQHHGDFFGPNGTACALGHLYRTEGLYEEKDSWSEQSTTIDEKYGLKQLIWISETNHPQFLDIFAEGEGPVALSNLIVSMNDSLCMTFNEIADWVEQNVIPDDIPGTIPVEWIQEMSDESCTLSLVRS